MESKNNHVCHITTVHPPEDVRIYHKECLSLANAGFKVSLIAPCSSEFTPSPLVQFIGFKKPASRLSRLLSAGYKAYKLSLSIDADVYHFHDPDFLWYAKKLKQKGKKVIYDVHEDVPRQIFGKYWIPSPFRKFISQQFEKFENSIAMKLDFIITATPYIHDRFSKFCKSVIAINNFPKLEEFPSVTEKEVNRDAVCYAGGLERVRGLTTMIEAISQTDVSLELAGNFSTNILKEEVQKMQGWSKVIYREFLKRDEITAFYSRAFAGLVLLHPLPNYLEAIPVKMLEYMAAGLPVIASDFPYWRKLIQEYDCAIFIDPLNTSRIAEAIRYLKKYPNLSSEMGHNGRKAVLDKFNWEIESKKLISVYNTLLNHSNHS